MTDVNTTQSDLNVRWAMLALQERHGPRDFSTLTISQAQYTQPWAVPYSQAFNYAVKDNRSLGHLMGSHITLHAAKTVGQIAAVFEGLDHSGKSITDDHRKVLAEKAADLMTAAMRLANLYDFSLARVLVERSEEKNDCRIDW